jgi:hypothetical protein
LTYSSYYQGTKDGNRQEPNIKTERNSKSEFGDPPIAQPLSMEFQDRTNLFGHFYLLLGWRLRFGFWIFQPLRLRGKSFQVPTKKISGT